MLAGESAALQADESRASDATWVTDEASFWQQVVGGLASGGIYGLLALAIVLIHRATGVLNFAQGELATLSAFICWTLIDHGWSFWPAFGATIALSFAGGALIERTLIRPIRNGPLLGTVILTIGLLLAVNGLDTWIWGEHARGISTGRSRPRRSTSAASRSRSRRSV